MTDVATDASSTQRTVGFTGRLGLWAVLILVVVLAIHPLGSTSLYDDPVQFLEHVTSYWVVIHMAAAIGLLAHHDQSRTQVLRSELFLHSRKPWMLTHTCHLLVFTLAC